MVDMGPIWAIMENVENNKERDMTVQLADVKIHRTELQTIVQTIYSGVQGEQGPGWAFPPTKAGYKLATRLAAAIRAGVAVSEPVVKFDINGRTYASVEAKVIGRTMNADLTRMGF